MTTTTAPNSSNPTDMTVIEMREPGKPDVLITGQREIPQPAENEVLIKVVAAGVNGPDLVQRRGHYPRRKGHLICWGWKYRASSRPSART